MTTQLFVNLSVKDLPKTVDFFTKLGFKFNPQFTDENATCMIINRDANVMLLVEKFFKDFIKKDIADASKSTEVIMSLSLENRQAVDEMIQKAIAAGSKEPREAQDFGWMYQRSFKDPNHHLWEVFWMDPKGPPTADI